MPGPLEGIRIMEFAGIGPAPFCGMMLADHGAEVIRIDRIGGPQRSVDLLVNPLARSHKSIAIDMKKTEGVALARDVAKSSDGLIEGFRPGVMERLGLGPDILLKDNPKLVYGRMTGWGQTGPLAVAAGHDINYIALTGALHTCGRDGAPPTPPVNYLGDFGGGGMLLAFGMAAGLLAVKNGASGQVIDCAMTDGSALLMAMTWGMLASGQWKDERGANWLDTGSHFYDAYETKDGRWVSIGSIEPQFYGLLRDKLGLAEDPDFDAQLDREAWPHLKEKLKSVFKTKTREEWCVLMEGSDVCFAPVLTLDEAPRHRHNAARETFVRVDGAVQPAPAPRYSATPAGTPRAAPKAGADADAVLASIGRKDAAALREAGVIG